MLVTRIILEYYVAIPTRKGYHSMEAQQEWRSPQRRLEISSDTALFKDKTLFRDEHRSTLNAQHKEQ